MEEGKGELLPLKLVTRILGEYICVKLPARGCAYFGTSVNVRHLFPFFPLISVAESGGVN